MTLRATIDFLLHEWLDTTGLTSRQRFADHSRETFDAVLDTCERIAREKYAPFNRLVDTQEPHFDGDKVTLPQATHDAFKAYAESGMLSAAQDYDIGGMQLPYSVEAAANAFLPVRQSASAPACCRWAMPTCSWRTAPNCKNRCSPTRSFLAFGLAPCV